MTNDSGLFLDKANVNYIPLYEAKMIWQFDHRYATYENATQANINEGSLPKPNESQKSSSGFFIKPIAWVPSAEVKKRLEEWNKNYLICFRGITSSVVERTIIFSFIPIAGVGNSAPIVKASDWGIHLVTCLISNFNSIVLDYIARQKVGGANLNFFIVKQLPLIPPEYYSKDDINFISTRVLELVYNSNDMKGFADDFGYEDKPFVYNDERRFYIKCELDAYFTFLYELNREEINYILDPVDVKGDNFPGETFRVLKEKEIKDYGEYRTKKLILEIYDEMAECKKNGTQYQTKLDPPPADPRVVHKEY